MSTKVCNKCNIEKDLKDFYDCITSTDKKRGACKICVSLQKKEKYKNLNDEEIKVIRERNKKWSINNPDKLKEMYKRNNSKQTTKDRLKQYAINNKEQLKQYKKDYFQKNRDKFLLKFKEYRKTEVYKISLRASAHNLRETKSGKKLTSKILFDLLCEQDGKCKYCGIELNLLEKYSVHIDHIIPICKGGTNDSNNVVWCCALCNLKKGVSLGR